MTTTATSFEPPTATIGAEVSGVDLTDLTPDTVAASRAALGELTPAHPVVPGLDDDHPEIYVLDSGDGGKAPVWHTDVTFTRTPPLGSVLRAVSLPPTGGDTCWTDLEAAYLALSPRFVNPGFTTHLQDVFDSESRALPAVFFAAIGRPEHSVRHRWRPGDVVVWDNRATAHLAVDDYGDQHRVMHRITIRGDEPAGPA